MRKLFFIVLLVILGPSVIGQNLSKMSKVSVLTCGTALESYTLYGHSAIWVKDPLTGVDKVFNFGMFDFQTPNFAAKFVKGNLFYYGDYTSFDRFIGSYVYENRSVYEQELDLDLVQKQQIYDQLSQRVLPPNKEFLYQFIEQNCTTKISDVLEQVIAQKVNSDVSLNKGTYREILSAYVDNLFLDKLGINLLLGYNTNKQSAKAFLPLSFMEALDNTFLDEKPLVSKKRILYQSTGFDQQQVSFYNSAWFFYLAMALIGVLCYFKATFSRITLGLFGVFGLFLLFICIYSSHMEFALNTSVLLFNPALLFLVFLNSSTKLYKILYWFVLISLGAYVVLNLTTIKLLLTLGLFFVTLVALYKCRPVLK